MQRKYQTTAQGLIALVAMRGAVCWYYSSIHGSSATATPGFLSLDLEADADHPSSRSLRISPSIPNDLKTIVVKSDANVSFPVIPMPPGQWLLDKDKTFAAPTCCDRSWGKRPNSPQECKATAGSMGGFLPSGKGGNGCWCENFQEEYTWSASDPWDANQVCQRLNNRRVLMIGDSTMAQAGSALLNAVYPAGCQTNFQYTISDTLILKNMGAKNRGNHWLDYAKKHNPDIIIVTAGAHIYGRENFERVIASVIKGTQELKQSNSNLTVVWKTQQPGGCTNSVLSTEADFHREHTDRYNYKEFYGRDLYALSVLPQAGIHVLDMRMLYYRSDAHIDSKEEEQKDCLHLCQPGPLDVMADLFGKLLRKLELMEKKGGTENGGEGAVIQ